jgi:hypothetical protein
LPQPSCGGLQPFLSPPTQNRVFAQIFGTRSAICESRPKSYVDEAGKGTGGLLLAHQPVTDRKNESAPNSFESWDARSNSPPPKSAHNHLTSGAGVWEWLRSATGSFSLKSRSCSRKQIPIISGQMPAAHLSRPRRRGDRGPARQRRYGHVEEIERRGLSHQLSAQPGQALVSLFIGDRLCGVLSKKGWGLDRPNLLLGECLDFPFS